MENAITEAALHQLENALITGEPAHNGLRVRSIQLYSDKSGLHVKVQFFASEDNADFTALVMDDDFGDL